MANVKTVARKTIGWVSRLISMLKKLKFIEAPIVATDVPWKKKNFFYKRLKRLAR